MNTTIKNIVLVKSLIIWAMFNSDVEFKIEEINFDDDPETIIAYKNKERFYERALEDFIN